MKRNPAHSVPTGGQVDSSGLTVTCPAPLAASVPAAAAQPSLLSRQLSGHFMCAMWSHPRGFCTVLWPLNCLSPSLHVGNPALQCHLSCLHDRFNYDSLGAASGPLANLVQPTVTMSHVQGLPCSLERPEGGDDALLTGCRVASGAV